MPLSADTRNRASYALTSNDAAKELCDAVDANTAADAGTVVFGYKTAGAGIGGVVTQATSRSTAVTLSTLCGQITTSSASLAAEAAAEFTVTNTQVKQGDVVALCQQSGSNGGNTDAYVSTVADGSFKVKVANNNPAAGTAETGAIILNFAIIRAVDS